MTSAIPLPTLARGLADELRHAADLADGLQNTVALDRAGDGIDAAFIQSAQALDLLTQKLEALHSFVHTLCDMLPGDCHIDPLLATHAITLASVKSRLCCTGADADAAGALELF